LGGGLGFAYARLRPEPAATAPPGERPEGTFTHALRTLTRDGDGFWGIGTFWGGVILFFIVFIILFSSLFTNFAGIREGLIGSISYWLEQHGVQRGNQPWYYYLLLLGAYETVTLVFGLAGTAYYLRRPTWLTSFLIWWWAVSLVIYSWAGEKMPWLIVHIALPLLLLAARYLGELFTSATRNAWEKRIAFGGAAILALWTVHTGWPVNFERPDTPRDLLVYTQTAPDVKQVMGDLERLSLQQTGDSKGLGIVVQSGTWWPFSWYLRDWKNAEYPAQLTAPPTKPVVLIAAEDDDKNRPYLSGYSRTRYKMRWWYPEDYRTIPEDIASSGGPLRYVMRPDVRAGLWKWLIHREPTQPLGSYDFYLYVKDGLTPNGAVPAAAAAPAGAQPGLPGQAQGVSQSGQQAQAPGQAPQPGQTAPGGQAPQAQAPLRADPEQYAARTVAVVPLVQFGATGRGPGQLNTPRGLALDAQGNVYVADSLNHRIQKFDRTGKLLSAWGTEGTGDGQFKEPMGVAVDGQGNIFVADTWNHRIQKLDSNGKFVTKWSGQSGGFWGPRGIVADSQGNVYVTDTGNKRIQKFDNGGRFLAQMGGPGAGPGQLNEPVGLAVTPEGRVYVADTNNRRIQAFDAAGSPLAEWPVAGWASGARNEPYLAVDGAGNVYATDPGGARVLKFAPNGEVLAVAGSAGRQPGQFELPLGIVVGDGGETVYVADSGNGRVQAIAIPQA
ncbi:MAG TPA: flippase activity-associated protein Agl23, partial [Chloroflexota bacterium]|nr:flippase activity-associated protein Agl23 [Chloroflexota bacterium]